MRLGAIMPRGIARTRWGTRALGRDENGDLKAQIMVILSAHLVWWLQISPSRLALYLLAII